MYKTAQVKDKTSIMAQTKMAPIFKSLVCMKSVCKSVWITYFIQLNIRNEFGNMFAVCEWVSVHASRMLLTLPCKVLDIFTPNFQHRCILGQGWNLRFWGHWSKFKVMVGSLLGELCSGRRHTHRHIGVEVSSSYQCILLLCLLGTVTMAQTYRQL